LSCLADGSGRDVAQRCNLTERVARQKSIGHFGLRGCEPVEGAKNVVGEGPQPNEFEIRNLKTKPGKSLVRLTAVERRKVMRALDRFTIANAGYARFSAGAHKLHALRPNQLQVLTNVQLSLYGVATLILWGQTFTLWVCPHHLWVYA
jgi:hypothetical protein